MLMQRTLHSSLPDIHHRDIVGRTTVAYTLPASRETWQGASSHVPNESILTRCHALGVFPRARARARECAGAAAKNRKPGSATTRGTTGVERDTSAASSADNDGNGTAASADKPRRSAACGAFASARHRYASADDRCASGAVA